MANIIFIDNFDSFSYNLVDQFKSLNHKVYIYRNDVSLEFISDILSKVDNPIVVISPGPGNPSQAGIIIPLIKHIKGKIPIIGICLGHQAIVQAYGGIVSHSNEIVHGKTALIKHNNHKIFNNINNPMTVARYHSLVAVDVPKSLNITSEVNGLVMSIINDNDKVCGFQFHPESIMTTDGAKLLENTINWILK